LRRLCVAPETFLYFIANLVLFAVVLVGWLEVRRPDGVPGKVSRGLAILFAAVQGMGLIWSGTTLGVFSMAQVWLATMLMVEVAVLLCCLLERNGAHRAATTMVATLAFVIHSYVLILAPPPPAATVAISPFARNLWYLLHVVGVLVASSAYVCAAGGAIAHLMMVSLSRGRSTTTETPRRNHQLSSLRALTFAFPWLTGAIFAHALWTYLAWGDYWPWRPSGIWPLVLWLTLVLTLHMGTRPRWRGTASALLTLLGLAVALLTLPLLGQGLTTTW
jgi:ABC-type transport system involved in cytochrome c biogenesis permease subunit